MKRAIALSSFFVALSALIACGSDPPDSLEQGDHAGNIASQGDDDDATKSTDTTTPAPSKPATSASNTSTTKPPAAKVLDASCTPAATTTKADCAKCCAVRSGPAKAVDDCACGAGKCASACGDSVCTGGVPSLGCGLCMLQNSCSLNLGLGGGGDNGDDDNEASLCLQQCASKP